MDRRRTASPPRTIVRTVASPPVRVQLAPIARRAGRAAGRAARRVGTAAAEEKHRLAAVGGAAMLGIAKRAGWPLPSVGPLGTSGTAALAAYLLYRVTGSRTASHVATGLASVAAYSLAREHEVAGGNAAVFDD